MKKSATSVTTDIDKKIAKLNKYVQSSSNKAVTAAVKQSAAFYAAFDETEAIPFITDSNGNIVIAMTGNTALVDDTINTVATEALTILEDSINTALKEFMT